MCTSEFPSFLQIRVGAVLFHVRYSEQCSKRPMKSHPPISHAIVSVAVSQCQVVVNAPYTCYPTILPVCLTPAIPLCRSSGSLPGLGDSLLGSLSGPSSVTSELLVSGCSYGYSSMSVRPSFLPYSCTPSTILRSSKTFNVPQSSCLYDRDETNLGVNT